MRQGLLAQQTDWVFVIVRKSGQRKGCNPLQMLRKMSGEIGNTGYFFLAYRTLLTKVFDCGL